MGVTLWPAFLSSLGMSSGPTKKVDCSPCSQRLRVYFGLLLFFVRYNKKGP